MSRLHAPLILYRITKYFKQFVAEKIDVLFKNAAHETLALHLILRFSKYLYNYGKLRKIMNNSIIDVTVS